MGCKIPGGQKWNGRICNYKQPWKKTSSNKRREGMLKKITSKKKKTNKNLFIVRAMGTKAITITAHIRKQRNFNVNLIPNRRVCIQ